MKKRFERMKNLRKISKQYGERLSERMIAKQKMKYTNQSYKKHQSVLVRLSGKKTDKSAPKRRFVVEGKVIRKSTKSDNYKIRFTRPGENWRQLHGSKLKILQVAKLRLLSDLQSWTKILALTTNFTGK